ncbi:DNA helicase RecG, partial [Patescibacteria group bacterium]|nr:DNA helicase RecG [Patescibacteria group bacterium]
KQSVIPAEWLQAMSPPARQGQSEVKRSRGISCHKSTNSKFDILVGTHALLSDKIKLDKLALVIIDEQQRFGVEQRGIIRKKGTNPHLLTMTATPIPRTVALTMYGDLDLSYLNEIPIGRKKIKTWLVPAEKRNAAYDWIRDQIKKTDSQTFIICPFIEQSESMQTVKAASKEYDRLKKQIFPNIKICLLHGKLKSKEKEQVMSDFKNKKLDILVATPIVEVGIDIPNATIIIIETAERFGLAQLHQLRGRVGRGDKQSYCLLFSESQTESVTKRLKSLETIYSGAELAELDLRLRGPGNLYGTAQHGIPKLKVASFSDTLLIQKARFEAQEVFPNITSYPLLEKKVNAITLQTITPD